MRSKQAEDLLPLVALYRCDPDFLAVLVIIVSPVFYEAFDYSKLSSPPDLTRIEPTCMLILMFPAVLGLVVRLTMVSIICNRIVLT